MTTAEEILREVRGRLHWTKADYDLVKRIDAHLAAPATEGQWVPKEPTTEMLEAGFGPFLAAHDLAFCKNEPIGPIYKAMLTAARGGSKSKGILHCSRHGGHGFVSDCVDCGGSK